MSTHNYFTTCSVHVAPPLGVVNKVHLFELLLQISEHNYGSFEATFASNLYSMVVKSMT